jgi:hypothetical protein
MMRVEELRKRADICRRAASVSTSGGANVDRILVALAERFELEIDILERQLQAETAD